MKIKFIKSSEKKRIAAQLNEQFGITNLPFLLIESGKEKIRAFTGHLSKEEIKELNSTLNIESMGLYLIKREHDLRLSFDAPHLLKSQISKNILKINKEQFEQWIRGKDLQIKKPRATYIIEYEEDFIGSGKSNEEKIFNHVPKDRRLKN